uniref:Phospholipid phosphatase 4 n=1 Tax=Cyprinodon variegatus TaxID=28743 RepID=A0A3Q2D6V9_CYPVA
KLKNLSNSIIYEVVPSGVFTEFLEPFERVIQPEELWLYKNPLVESDHIPKRVMFVNPSVSKISLMRNYKLSFYLCVLSSAVSLALALNGVFTNTIKLIVGRPRPDYFQRCFPDGQMNAKMLCTGEPELVSEGRKSFPSSHSSCEYQKETHCFNSVQSNCTLLIPKGKFSFGRAHPKGTQNLHHNAFVGGVIGLLFAYISYRQHYPPFLHTDCHLPYAEECLDRHKLQSDPALILIK